VPTRAAGTPGSTIWDVVVALLAPERGGSPEKKPARAPCLGAVATGVGNGEGKWQQAERPRARRRLEGAAKWAEKSACGYIDFHPRSYSWCNHLLALAWSRLQLAAQSSNGRLHEACRFVLDALNSA
jgi:hypothetical protein